VRFARHDSEGQLAGGRRERLHRRRTARRRRHRGLRPTAEGLAPGGLGDAQLEHAPVVGNGCREAAARSRMDAASPVGAKHPDRLLGMQPRCVLAELAVAVAAAALEQPACSQSQPVLRARRH
jgi:hypothetical protein